MLWPKSVELHPEDEILVLSFDDDLPIGDAILGMEFQGTLNDQMRGFYRRCCSAQSSSYSILFCVVICCASAFDSQDLHASYDLCILFGLGLHRLDFMGSLNQNTCWWSVDAMI